MGTGISDPKIPSGHSQGLVSEESAGDGQPRRDRRPPTRQLLHLWTVRGRTLLKGFPISCSIVQLGSCLGGADGGQVKQGPWRTASKSTHHNRPGQDPRAQAQPRGPLSTQHTFPKAGPCHSAGHSVVTSTQPGEREEDTGDTLPASKSGRETPRISSRRLWSRSLPTGIKFRRSEAILF